jgi:internalin A
MHVEIKPHIDVSVNPKLIQKTEVEAKAEANVEINLKIDLPAIQTEFEHLKELMLESNPDPNLGRKLKEIGDSLDEASAETEKEKLNKPLNKVGRFLKELEDEKLKYHKIVSGTKKGIELAQKLAGTYNKFAQWLALPQVPDLFLGT